MIIVLRAVGHKSIQEVGTKWQDFDELILRYPDKVGKPENESFNCKVKSDCIGSVRHFKAGGREIVTAADVSVDPMAGFRLREEFDGECVFVKNASLEQRDGESLYTQPFVLDLYPNMEDIEDMDNPAVERRK